MNIGGLVPLTLSDYPGRLAAVVFTQGCNFRCPFCHNGPLIAHPSARGDLLPESEVMQFLQSRRDQLDGVVLSGGEPTLQPDLLEFLRRVRPLGYAVKLDTNGSRPEVLRRILGEGLIDFLAMDIKAPWQCYDRLAGIAVDTAAIRTSVELIARSGIPHVFRTTVVPEMLSDADLRAIARLLPAGSPHRRQVFRPTHALASWLRPEKPQPEAATDPRNREGVLA